MASKGGQSQQQQFTDQGEWFKAIVAAAAADAMAGVGIDVVGVLFMVCESVVLDIGVDMLWYESVFGVMVVDVDVDVVAVVSHILHTITDNKPAGINCVKWHKQTDSWRWSVKMDGQTKLVN